MAEKCNTYNYRLNVGPVVVYIGITKYPGLTKARYRYRGVVFTNMNVDKTPQTYDDAKREAERRLEQYKKEHNGRLPRHNQDPRSSVESIHRSAFGSHPRMAS